MKGKFLLAATVCMVISASLPAQEVAQVQKSLITKRTATWCPYCGTWGWTFFESLQVNVSDKSVLIAAHYGGSTLENPVSAEWVSNLGGSSQPRFFVNNEIQNVTQGNLADALTVVKDKVDAIAAQQPVANVGILTSWSGNDLSVQTKTRFFQPAAGEYYLGIYLVEDKVLAGQNGQSGTPEHSRVLRGSATGTTFGELLANGNIAAGTEFQKAYTAGLGGYDIENLRIAGVIWKKEGGKYLAVNVWEIAAKPVAASATGPALFAGEATLQPNPSEGDAMLALRLEEGLNCEIVLFNSTGQKEDVLFTGGLSAGAHFLRIPGDKMKTAGVYIVRIQTTGGAYLSLPLVIQP